MRHVTPTIGLNVLDAQGNLYEVIGHRPDAPVRNMPRLRGMVDLRNVLTGHEFQLAARALGFWMCWTPTPQGDPAA